MHNSGTFRLMLFIALASLFFASAMTLSPQLTGASVADDSPGFFSILWTSFLELISVQEVPALSVTIATSEEYNTSSENITLTATPSTNSTLKHIIDWRQNGTSITFVNFALENHPSASSEVIDYSTYQNNGSVIGAALNSSDGHDGFGSYEFDGNNDVLQVFDTGQTSLNELTILMWVKPDSNAGSYRALFSATSGTSNDYQTGITLDMGPASTTQLSYLSVEGPGVSGGTDLMTSSTAFGTWTHIAARVNTSAIQLYVNGVPEGSRSRTSTAQNFDDIRIGGRYYFGLERGYLDGSISSVQVFNSALSDTQIQEIYDNSSYDILSETTAIGQTWQACVTPNDQSSDGSTVCSNNITLLDPALVNRRPTIQYATIKPYIAYNKTVHIEANVTDTDGLNGTANVTFTVNSPSGNLFTNQLGLNTSTIWNSSTFTLSESGQYNYTIIATDTAGLFTATSGVITYPSITMTLSPNPANAGGRVTLQGFINQSDGSIIPNTTCRAYIDGVPATAIHATGGNITSDGIYTIHTFTSNDIFTVDSTTNVEVLVVAGGGGGGGGIYHGGGGGAGGLIYNNSYPLVAGSIINVTIGAGGAGGTNSHGSNGQNSTFGTLVAIGGGGGGNYLTIAGQPGGSGGGSPYNRNPGGTGTAEQGNNGGNGVGSPPNYGSGGGGGAGANGQSGTSTTGGAGGVGLNYSAQFGTSVGEQGVFAGGGGGSTFSGGTSGVGGLGGGGDGSTANGNNALANTGGGGGGGERSGTVGGAGGSGIVILKYLSGPCMTNSTGNYLMRVNTPSAEGVVNVTINSTTASSQGVSITRTSQLLTLAYGIYEPPIDATSQSFVSNGSINNTIINGGNYDAAQFVTYSNQTSGRRLIRVFTYFNDSATDFSSLTLRQSPNKTLTTNFSEVLGVASTFSMYLPRGSDLGLTICPNANTLDNTNTNCAGAIGFTHADAASGRTISGYTASIDGSDYRVDGLTGTGLAQGVNISLFIFDDTNDNTYGQNQTYYVTETVGFYANYTKGSLPANTTNGACTITYNESGNIVGPTSMTYNSTTQLYTNFRSFSTYGTVTYDVSCTDNGETLNATDTADISSPLHFSADFYSFNVSRKEGETIALNFTATATTYFPNISGHAEQISPELPIGFIGALSPNFEFDINGTGNFTAVLGLTLGRAIADNYSFTVNLTTSSLVQPLDTATITIYLPPITEANYNISTIATTNSFTISNDQDAGVICSDTTSIITVTNTGALNISDLALSFGGNLPIRSIPDSITDMKLYKGESINITVFGLINETTPSGNVTVSVTTGNVNRTEVITYTSPATSGWVSPPTLSNITLSFGPALTARCTNGVGYDASIRIPSVYDLDQATSAQFVTTFAEQTCPDGIATTATMFVNGNQVLQTSPPYGTVASPITNLSILQDDNAITQTSGPPGGHYCSGGASTIQVTFASTSSAYCTQCSPDGTEEGNFADGLDNDCDGFVDCDDSDSCGAAACIGAGGLHEIWCPAQETCNDGIDNDGNGLTDCQDVNVCCGSNSCSNNPYCATVSLICDYGNYNTLCVMNGGSEVGETNLIQLHDLEFSSGSIVNVTTLQISASGDVRVQSGAMVNAEGVIAGGTGVGGGPNLQQTGGGGHGGTGGDSGTPAYGVGGSYYGSSLYVNTAGSSGGGNLNLGGGLIRFTAAGDVTNNGIINANASGGGTRAGGSGGGIFINATNVYGSGTYLAAGSNGGGGYNAGGGGGGRIAIHANNVDTLSSSNFDTSAGNGANGAFNGQSGTVVLVDKDDNILYVPGSFRFESADFPLVAGMRDVTYSSIVMTQSQAHVNDDTRINVNTFTMDSSSSLSEEGDDSVTINATSSITLNNVSVEALITYATSATILSGAVIDGTGTGNTSGAGLGLGQVSRQTGGGAYGGNGGDGFSIELSGSYYDSALVPTSLGSAGGLDAGVRSSGGGYFSYEGTTLTNNGSIIMNGQVTTTGGGSGGGIFVNATNIYGSGTYIADGASPTGCPYPSGGGGGGRIALWANNVDALSPNLFSVSGGTGCGGGTSGEAGTTVLLDIDNNSLIVPVNFRFQSNDYLAVGGFRQANYSTIDLTGASAELEDNFQFNVEQLISNNQSLITSAIPQNTLDYSDLTINASYQIILNDAIIQALRLYSPTVTILPTGTINGTGTGNTSGIGIGGGQVSRQTGGGGYGGLGGDGFSIELSGSYYDSALVPTSLGSAGGLDAGVRSSGGGYFSYEGTTLTNNGSIIMNGQVTTTGGGSGGGIFVNATNIYGGGTYIADGASPTGCPYPSGGGGGGRIALWANNVDALSPNLFSVSGGTGCGGGTSGEAGTTVLLDIDNNSLIVPVNFRFQSNDYLAVGGFRQANYSTIDLTGASAELEDNFNFVVNQWISDTQSSLSDDIPGGTTTYSSAVINATTNVTLNNVSLRKITIYTPIAEVYATGIISTTGKGNNTGPGLGGGPTSQQTGGGGHGGSGGNTVVQGGSYYGSALHPTQFGSGGGGSYSYGGGLIEYRGTSFINNGQLRADGQGGYDGSYVRAASSGGSILINASQILGSGTYHALGGTPTGCAYPGGGGGGGRIALWTNNGEQIDATTLYVDGGIGCQGGTAGQAGTSVVIDTDSDTIYAGEGFRSEPNDLVLGEIMRGSFIATDLQSVRLGVNTIFNMSALLQIINTTVEGDIYGLTLRSNTLSLNNSFLNVDNLTLIYDQSLEDTATIYKSTVNSLRIQRPSYGSIQFTSGVTSLSNLSQHIIINNNLARVNSTALPGLNTSARITLLTPFSTQPSPKYDPEDDGTFINCPGSICSPVSFNAGTGEFVFDVTHFTGFSSGFNADLTIYDSADPEGGDNIVYAGTTAYYYANYTNSSSGENIPATCLINITGITSSTIMNFNTSGTNLYEYSTIMPTSQSVNWSVSCTNMLGLANLTATDDINISPSIAPVPEFSDFALMLVLGLVLGGFVAMRRQR